MQILQGQYLKSIESAKGTLKGIQLKTPKGKQSVAIPKALRAIAQAEIAQGDEIRVWARPLTKKERKKGGQFSPDQFSKKKSSKGLKLTALQIIPLTPKTRVAQPESAKQKSKDRKQSAKKLTVQLCQKKNCCRRGGDELWSAFEKAAKEARTDEKARNFKLEAVGCLGGCKNGPNIRLLPKNVKHRSVKPSDIQKLLSS